MEASEGVYLPLIRSQIFGEGFPFLSERDGPIELSKEAPLSPERFTEALEMIRKEKVESPKPQSDPDRPTTATTANFAAHMNAMAHNPDLIMSAEVAKYFSMPRIVFEHGTVAPIIPIVAPITSEEDFLKSFRHYPIHRTPLDDSTYKKLAGIYDRLMDLPDPLRNNIGKGLRYLLGLDYPFPGPCGDRYGFTIPARIPVMNGLTCGVTMPISSVGLHDICHRALCVRKGRKGESASQLAQHHAKGDLVEALVTSLPLSLTTGCPFDETNISEGTVRTRELTKLSDDLELAFAISRRGIEYRRLDYMFPNPLEWIDENHVAHWIPGSERMDGR